MPDDTQPSNIALIIMQAFRAQIAAVLARLAARGFEDMTSSFASVMPFLDTNGTRSTVLAQQAGVTKQAMSQLVRLMEERNYVEQVPDATDTRAKVVRLTKRGVDVKQACVEVRKELTTAAIKAIGKNNLAKLETDLNKLVESLAPPHQ